MPTSPEFTNVTVPARIADLEFSYLRPSTFQVIRLPDDKPDFTTPTSFFPLELAMATYGVVLISVGARPAFDSGSVQDWAEFLSHESKLEVLAQKTAVVGGLPAVVLELRQASEGDPMRLRSAYIEDGKRLINLSIVAPEAIWGSVEPMLQLSLSSFRLAEPRGPTAPLTRSDVAQPAAPIERRVAEPAVGNLAAEITPAAAPTPLSELALADDAATLEPEHPLNARLRDSGNGLVPRVLETNLLQKYAVIGAGALAATFRLPLGWHVSDNGRRTLVFDAGGKIQISLNLRRDDGDADALLTQIQSDAQREQPALDPQRIDFAPDLPGLVLRNYRDGDDLLVQAFVLKRLREDGLIHVARATAAPADMTQAMNLTEVLLRTLDAPVATS